MALQLRDLLTAIRDRHPAFARPNVPHASLARYLTGYQRRLVSLALQTYRDFLAQQVSIAIQDEDDNTIGVVGAGTTGGTPGEAAGGVFTATQSPAGSAIEYGGPVVVHYAETTVSTADNLAGFGPGGSPSGRIQKTGSGWAVNQHDGRLVRITAGPGQPRLLTIFYTDPFDRVNFSVPFTELPTSATMFEIVTMTPLVDQDFGAVTDIPAMAERSGYLVKLSSSGVPYLDLADPLIARYDVGVTIPPHHAILGGTVHYTRQGQSTIFRRDGEVYPADAQEVEITDYARRFYWPGRPSIYLQNGQVFLGGLADHWKDATSIDLRIVPVPPALAALDDYLLVPDSAYDTIVSHGAWFAGNRVNALPEYAGSVDVKGLAAEAAMAQASFLEGLTAMIGAVAWQTRDE